MSEKYINAGKEKETEKERERETERKVNIEGPNGE